MRKAASTFGGRGVLPPGLPASLSALFVLARGCCDDGSLTSDWGLALGGAGRFGWSRIRSAVSSSNVSAFAVVLVSEPDGCGFVGSAFRRSAYVRDCIRDRDCMLMRYSH